MPGFRTGTEDSSPKTEVGTGGMRLGSLGPERITAPHLSERNWPPKVEREAKAGFKGRILSSKVLRGGRRLGERYMPLFMRQPGRLQTQRGVQRSPRNAKHYMMLTHMIPLRRKLRPREAKELAGSHSQESGSVGMSGSQSLSGCILGVSTECLWGCRGAGTGCWPRSCGGLHLA